MYEIGVKLQEDESLIVDHMLGTGCQPFKHQVIVPFKPWLPTPRVLASPLG